MCVLSGRKYGDPIQTYEQFKFIQYNDGKNGEFQPYNLDMGVILLENMVIGGKSFNHETRKNPE